MNEHMLQQVRLRFSQDRFATENGAVIDQIGPGWAVCSMELGPQHRNAAGAVMGGAIFTLADFAFAVAANWQGEKLHVSRSSQIVFIGAAKGSRLTARASCLKEGSRTCCYLVEIRDEWNNLVAHVTADGFIC